MVLARRDAPCVVGLHCTAPPILLVVRTGSARLRPRSHQPQVRRQGQLLLCHELATRLGMLGMRSRLARSPSCRGCRCCSSLPAPFLRSSRRRAQPLCCRSLCQDAQQVFVPVQEYPAGGSERTTQGVSEVGGGGLQPALQPAALQMAAHASAAWVGDARLPCLLPPAGPCSAAGQVCSWCRDSLLLAHLDGVAAILWQEHLVPLLHARGNDVSLHVPSARPHRHHQALVDLRASGGRGTALNCAAAGAARSIQAGDHSPWVPRTRVATRHQLIWWAPQSSPQAPCPAGGRGAGPWRRGRDGRRHRGVDARRGRRASGYRVRNTTTARARALPPAAACTAGDQKLLECAQIADRGRVTSRARHQAGPCRPPRWLLYIHATGAALCWRGAANWGTPAAAGRQARGTPSLLRDLALPAPPHHALPPPPQCACFQSSL